MIRSACVFCGSRFGNDPRYERDARDLGRGLGEARIQLVYGGGHVGLMGATADAALAAGGEVIGVLPRGLFSKEVGHTGLTRLEMTDDMHTRKARMAALSEAFIALPGGFGTLDELCEIVTWAQLGLHRKPVVLLNTAGFWDGFLTFVDKAAQDGFIPVGHANLIKVVTSVDEVLAFLRHHS